MPSKAPSLLSMGNGGISYETVQRHSACSRCKKSLASGMRVGSLKVRKSGFTNNRRFCLSCVIEIVNKTQEELDKISQGAKAVGLPLK